MDTTTGGTDGYEPSPAVKAHLDELDRPGLRELVLTLAGRSETARQALETAAGLAEGRRDPAENDLVRRADALLSAPNGYEGYDPYDDYFDGYNDNGYAADIGAFLDELEALMRSGGADAAALPLRMIMTRLSPDLEEGLGDLEGLTEAVCERAADLYARACREGSPDVEALAVWLVQHRLAFPNCPTLALADFLAALGEEGLAAYRRAVADAPAGRERLRLERELADSEGAVDRAVDRAVELLARGSASGTQG